MSLQCAQAKALPTGDRATIRWSVLCGLAQGVPAPSKSTRDYFVFALVASLYLLPFMCVMLPRSNEGSIIYGAERIVSGDVFARDFFEVMGPGSFYIAAFFLKVLGTTFLATRLWLYCSSLGIAICLYFLSRRVCPRNRLLPTLVIAGTWFGMQWPSVSHHVDSDLFSLFAVVCVVAWEERHRRQMLYLAGACIGITLWIHQSKGVLLFIALLVWCIIRNKPGEVKSVAIAARIAIGGGIVTMAACAYFLSRGALVALVQANVIWPARNYTSINRVPYALGIFSEYWCHWASLHGKTTVWSIVFASVLIIPFVFIAALPPLLFTVARLVKAGAVNSSNLLCLLTGWALWLSELHRTDIYHLAFGCPLLLMVCVGIIGGARPPSMRMGLQVIAISAVCLMTTNLLQAVTTRQVATRVGRIGMFGSESLLRLIDENASRGQEVFFYPDCPSYYFLTATRNPTRFSLLIYGYNTTAEFQQVIETLDRRRVRLVVWDSHFQERTVMSVFPEADPSAEPAQIMETYLKSRYRQIGLADGARVLLRND